MTHATPSAWPAGPEETRLLCTMDGGVHAQCPVLQPDRYAFFTTAPGGPPSIARGAGLSYAAASFGAGTKSIELGAFDRVLGFDAATGQIEVEAGITLQALFRFLTPRGRYLPVQPGYGSIAIGGCIGSDVHGKNPAKDGTFISQVQSLRLFHPDHGTILLSESDEPDLFRATCGGLGLTGLVLTATLRTRALPGWSSEATIHHVANAHQAAELLPQIAAAADLCYAWLDCSRPRAASFGRGMVFDIRISGGGTNDGEPPPPRLSPASRQKLPLCLMNRWSSIAINLAHGYRSRRSAGPRHNGLPKVLFPILGNELYFHLFGRDGFHEYQVILPNRCIGDYFELTRELAIRHSVCITLAAARAFAGRNDLLRFDGDGVSINFGLPRNSAIRVLSRRARRIRHRAGRRPSEHLQRLAPAARRVRGNLPRSRKIPRHSPRLGSAPQIPLRIVRSARAMKSLVFGASAGVGRALGRCLAARGHDLVLASRGAADLAAEAAHLRLSHGVNVDWLALDATDPAAAASQLAALCGNTPPRNLLFPVGLTASDDDCLLPPQETIALINANLTTVIATIATLLPALIESGGGNVVGFGSIAAIRGRGANAVYAAAKRGLESYFESLRHRTAETGVRVQFYRLGYVATQMSYGQPMLLPAADPDSIARRVADGLNRDLGLVHLPRFWAGIAPIVRAVPWRIFRHAKFLTSSASGTGQAPPQTPPKA